jgi:hypothetical protein
VYEVDPPQDLIPKNLSDALVEIGKMQVYIRNQEARMAELASDLDSERKLLGTVSADLAALKTQLSAGWKALTGLGAFTLAISYLLYNLKNILGLGK